MKPWPQFSHHQMHQWLSLARPGLPFPPGDTDGLAQALFCPYYIPLEGKLGADWGVIVNPASKLFGQLVFEHDYCGCPVTEADNFMHLGANQDANVDIWWEGWEHTHDLFCVPDCKADQWDDFGETGF